MWVWETDSDCEGVPKYYRVSQKKIGFRKIA